MRYVACVLMVLMLGGPALAQDDPMEAQRCIWRCLADSKGADDPAYLRCTERNCSGEPRKKPRKAKPRPSKRSDAETPGQWSFGEHDRLGVSAHVQVGDGAFGLSCPSRTREPNGYAVVSRMTTDLAPDTATPIDIAYVWDDPFSIGGSTIYPEPNGSVFEKIDNYCDSNVDMIRKSGTLLLLREKMQSLESAGGVTRMTVDGKSGPVIVETSQDLAKLADPVTIPLAGAARAIAQLANTCPALRRQMAEGCYVD